MEFRAEFFNVFNLVNFGLPSNILRGSGFGVISKTAGTFAADPVFAEIDLLKRKDLVTVIRLSSLREGPFSSPY